MRSFTVKHVPTRHAHPVIRVGLRGEDAPMEGEQVTVTALDTERKFVGAVTRAEDPISVRLEHEPTEEEARSNGVKLRDLAEALLTLWEVEGGECHHGVGFFNDCDGTNDDGSECDHNRVRAMLRAASDITAAG